MSTPKFPRWFCRPPDFPFDQRLIRMDGPYVGRHLINENGRCDKECRISVDYLSKSQSCWLELTESQAMEILKKGKS